MIELFGNKKEIFILNYFLENPSLNKISDFNKKIKNSKSNNCLCLKYLKEKEIN